MLLKHILVFLVAFIVAWATTKILIPLLQKGGILDVPNIRSSHDVPTPRGGGLGIIVGLAAALIISALLGLSLPTREFLLGGLLIAAIGFVDDRSGGLSVWLRLILQLVAAGLIIFQAGGITHLPLPKPLNTNTGLLAIPLAFVWIVGVTNLYNFLDGIDGFAGLQGATAGLSVAFLAQSDIFTTVGFTVAGACGGFLIHNWHPARVFMGDIGSGTLGFVLAGLPFQLHPSVRGDAIFVVAMCLWFFLADGIFTILRRLSHGEKVWEAHRSHLYQRLVKTGLRHDQVTIRVMGAAILLAALAVVSVRLEHSSGRWSVLAGAIACFFAYFVWTASRERTYNGFDLSPRDDYSGIQTR